MKVSWVECLNHNPRKHRDGKPAWCKSCKLTKDFEIPVSRIGKNSENMSQDMSENTDNEGNREIDATK